MIEHVYRRTAKCQALQEVYVATCDQEIAQAALGFGAKVIMTSSAHQRASDRVAEVARSIRADIYVLVQGDEPMIVPEMIDAAVKPLLEDPDVVCANLIAPILSVEDFEDPNTIKVVMARNGDALYFSREPLPTGRQLPFRDLPAHKQVCVIPFRRDFLLKYAELEPTPLEEAESIDMLRALEHGYRIRLVRTSCATHAVDTPADLARVEALLQSEPLAHD
jgi:3-deoxy-manno-octulosonate cytidylyltransferase (CMP-KDO synthetase)